MGPEPAGTPAERLAAAFSRLVGDLRGRQGVLPSKLDGILQLKFFDPAAKDDPAAATILASGLDALTQAAYLASTRFTRVNRGMAGLTDSDDIRFQKALIERLAKAPQGGGSDAGEEP